MNSENQESKYDSYDQEDFSQYRLTDPKPGFYDPTREAWPQIRLKELNEQIRHYPPAKHPDLHKEKDTFLLGGKPFDPFVFASAAGFTANQSASGQRYAIFKSADLEITLSKGFHTHVERENQLTLSIRKGGQTEYIQKEMPQTFADFYRLLGEVNAPINQGSANMTAIELKYREMIAKPKTKQPERKLSSAEQINRAMNPHLYK